MRYFIVLDMPDTTYPVSDPFYAPDGKDPFGRSSLAGWIESALDETYLGSVPGRRTTSRSTPTWTTSSGIEPRASTCFSRVV